MGEVDESLDKYELEVKISVNCEKLDNIKTKILSRGGRLEERVVEEDVYYQHPCRDFLATDEALRVRYVNGRIVEVTYKGPKIIVGRSKKRVEYSIPATVDVPRILELLGFRPSITVKKEREYYVLESAAVTLDRVEGLGCFIEVEAKGDIDPSRLADELGVEGEIVRESYAELVARLGRSS